MRRTTPTDWHRLVAAFERGFAEAEAQIDREQAVKGLDSRSERALHPLLAASLRWAGYEAQPEARFPADRARKARNVGARCDLVITPEGTMLEHDGAQLGLFDATARVRCEDAAWLEVKVIAQHRPSGPNGRYAYALTHPVWSDVRKLASDPDVTEGAVLIVLFTEDGTVADHDLEVWASHASMRGLPLGPRITGRVAIGDRLGNRVCTLALFPIVRVTT